MLFSARTKPSSSFAEKKKGACLVFLTSHTAFLTFYYFRCFCFSLVSDAALLPLRCHLGKKHHPICKILKMLRLQPRFSALPEQHCHFIIRKAALSTDFLTPAWRFHTGNPGFFEAAPSFQCCFSHWHPQSSYRLPLQTLFHPAHPVLPKANPSLQQ